jgi:hypothetical protein
MADHLQALVLYKYVAMAALTNKYLATEQKRWYCLGTEQNRGYIDLCQSREQAWNRQNKVVDKKIVEGPHIMLRVEFSIYGVAHFTNKFDCSNGFQPILQKAWTSAIKDSGVWYFSRDLALALDDPSGNILVRTYTGWNKCWKNIIELGDGVDHPRSLVLFKCIAMADVEGYQQRQFLATDGDSGYISLRQCRSDAEKGNTIDKASCAMVRVEFSPYGVAYFTTMYDETNRWQPILHKVWSPGSSHDQGEWHFTGDLPVSSRVKDGNNFVSTEFFSICGR